MSEAIDSELFRNLIGKWPDYALKLLYRQYYGRLLRIAERKTNNRKASEDIVQEAFIEIWKKSKWIAAQENFLIGPYLIGIVKNNAISFFRDANKEWNRSPDLIQYDMDAYAVWKSGVTQQSTHAMLRTIVETLPIKERECMQLKYFHDMSNEAIARQLGISKKTVEKYITRALKNLRKQKAMMQ